jgi:phosphate/sulfate permease
MSEIYLILVIVLFALAISDLIVGVSNDAVNFLNSAVGSKAAPNWVIFGIASLGVLAGATFSSGMMEVARKGIFNPEMFVFADIMIIFLTVMITDIILLDVFNTFGMPTSTTVSIVFELLGAAVAVSIVKIRQMGDATTVLGDYINSEKALLIITGILLSVVIAFTVGAIVHWITRLLFSFRYEKRFKMFGSIYGGLAIAAITYFMIIKGAKGASFMSDETVSYIKQNMMVILTGSFVIWTILLQLLRWFLKLIF